MNKETPIMHRVMLALSEAGCIVWRNNCGAVQSTDGRFVRFGVGNPGGTDLIGICRGRFLAVEVKTSTGRATTEQQRFINAVLTAGGIAGIVRSPEEALSLIREK